MSSVAMPARRGARPCEAVRVPAILREAHELGERRLMSHPFLRRCETGTATMAELRRYLVQQGHYGRHFTRYLCALISQLAHGDEVMRLAGNLAEELGFGGGAGVPHARMYADMLRQFDLSLDREPASPQTQALIDTMFMLCRAPGGASGLGALCLGAEAIVPAMYRRIIAGFSHHGVPVARLAFFQVHVECDDDHAGTMFDILADACARSPVQREAVVAAAAAAISARMRMLDSVLEPPALRGE